LLLFIYISILFIILPIIASLLYFSL